MLKFPGARCILLVYSSILAVITKESFVKIILYLCAMSTVWTGSCFQGTWNTIGRRWCRHRYNRRSEYSGPMEGNTGRTTSFFQRRDVIFIEVDFWLGFLSVCLFLFFLAVLCGLWDLSSLTRVTAVKARILTTLGHQGSPLDWGFECWIGIG